jgi:hypothetical protein
MKDSRYQKSFSYFSPFQGGPSWTPSASKGLLLPFRGFQVSLLRIEQATITLVISVTEIKGFLLTVTVKPSLKRDAGMPPC